jgi:N-acetylneuraminate synthase/sialic acid synthase
MPRQLLIGDREISDDSEVFVIAEIGHNHQGDLELCERLFDAAARAGANAVKLQKRDNTSLYTNDFFNSPYVGPTSFGSTYGTHREFLEFDLKAYKHLKKYAENLGLVFFSTAFDLKSVDFLMNVGVPVIKIASGDLKSLPLLRYASSKQIPLIISTGGADFSDVQLAMNNVTASNVGLLQCTAAYPAEPKDMDLRVIDTYRNSFTNTVIGLSSHDRGIAFPVVAAALGARIVEKHFTIDRSMKGTDHAFSLEPSGMEKMVRDLGLVVRAMGDGIKKLHESEHSGIRKMGKMLVYSREIKAGTRITEADLSMKSPQEGISPQSWDSVVGSTLKHAVSTDQPVELKHFH